MTTIGPFKRYALTGTTNSSGAATVSLPVGPANADYVVSVYCIAGGLGSAPIFFGITADGKTNPLAWFKDGAPNEAFNVIAFAVPAPPET